MTQMLERGGANRVERPGERQNGGDKIKGTAQHLSAQPFRVRLRCQRSAWYFMLEECINYFRHVKTSYRHSTGICRRMRETELWS